MYELNRTINLPLLLLYGLGNILGAGIYVLIGKIVGEAGMLTPVAFLVAAVVAGMSALTYSELSSRYPFSAGVAIYVDEGFNLGVLTRLTGILVASIGIVVAATIARGFYGYLDIFFQIPEWVAITGLVLSLGTLTIWGISQSVGMAALMTMVEIFGLILVIWAGSDSLGNIPQHIDVMRPTLNAAEWTGILLGAFIAFFAFTGYEDMVTIAEEIKKPERTLPLGIILSLFIASIIYALIAMVAILSVDQEILANSTAPLTDVLLATSNINPATITIISIFAIVNGALIQMIMVSRLLYGMARKGWLWEWLTVVNPRTRTPVNATILVVLVVMCLALWFPLEGLAKTTSFLLLTVFILVNTALIRIKLTEAEVPAGIINNPLWVPVTGLISSSGLMLFQCISWLLVHI